METSPTTCRTLEEYYHINANTFDKQYKDVLSDLIQLIRTHEWHSSTMPEIFNPPVFENKKNSTGYFL